MGYALNLPYALFVDLVNKAIEETHNDRLFQRWIPYQSELPLTEFKAKLTEIQSTTTDQRSADMILQEVEINLARMRN